ncbi:hypothetical protein BDY19DRAFT_890542 [Irpex rosettiformis]|uniref:Uncharacterized protein n=1 Tax=Irpex rosettiformis TaxID=378272 RepID=A0ACB8U403_9APHY|nr:hypothetical protein BDY19DRAFT_890542 [Irpex rosettiformis]
MFSSLTLVSLLSLAYPAIASPAACFNAKFELLAFGLGGKDWNAGTQDSWASGTAKDITTSGRPPFDGANTTCYTSQFYNAIYVLNGDASNPSALHIFDAGSNAWSTQSVTAGTFDPSSFDAILDHDTNVFYALSKGELFFLDMGSLVTANATAVSWTDVQQAPLPSGYQPVMALAQNHVHFLDVPGLPAGSADIFVIHFSKFQPDAQSYPNSNGNTFPAAHGQATSFFQASGVQQEFAFIPDDGSATYVVNVETNTTASLAGPTTKDASAKYSASITALVQLDSKGALSFLPYKQGDDATNSKATWQSVANLAASVPAGSTSSNTGSNSSSTNGTSSPSGSKSASSSHPSATGNSSSGASGNTSGATSLSFPAVISFSVAGILATVAMSI